MKKEFIYDVTMQVTFGGIKIYAEDEESARDELDRMTPNQIIQEATFTDHEDYLDVELEPRETHRETYYEVHSDLDENNVYQSFEDYDDALDYAIEHIADETYIQEVNVDVDDDEDIVDEFSRYDVWGYDEYDPDEDE